MLGKRSYVCKTIFFPQFDDLDAQGVLYLGLTWRCVKGGIQAEMRQYLNKLVLMTLPYAPISPADIATVPRLLAQVRWLVNHVLPQFAHAVSRPAQKPEDELCAEDVRSMNRRDRSAILSICSGQRVYNMCQV